MKKVSVNLYGIQGTGRNKTEAKAAAGHVIEAALYGSYTPTLLACRNRAVLVFRDALSGWSFSFLDVAEMALETVTRKTLYGCAGYENEQVALRSALIGLAQQVWLPSDGLQPPGELLTEDNDVAEFRGWARWQLEFRQLREHDVDDEHARRVLSGLEPWPVTVSKLTFTSP